MQLLVRSEKVPFSLNKTPEVGLEELVNEVDRIRETSENIIREEHAAEVVRKLLYGTHREKCVVGKMLYSEQSKLTTTEQEINKTLIWPELNKQLPQQLKEKYEKTNLETGKWKKASQQTSLAKLLGTTPNQSNDLRAKLGKTIYEKNLAKLPEVVQLLNTYSKAKLANNAYFNEKIVGEKQAQKNKEFMNYSISAQKNKQQIITDTIEGKLDTYIAENVPEDIRKHNQEIIRNSKEFKEYTQTNNIKLDSTHNLEDKTGIEYGRIQLTWKPEQITLLEDYLTAIHPNKREEELNSDKELLELEFGRSIYAIQLKAGRMGLIQERIFGEAETGEVFTGMYALPTIPLMNAYNGEQQLRNEYIIQQSNQESQAILQNPTFIGGQTTHQENTLLITPIPYKGKQLGQYTPKEQEVLTAIENKPHLSAAFDNQDNVYTQIKLRNGKLETQTIQTKSGITLDVFVEETPLTYEQRMPEPIKKAI